MRGNEEPSRRRALVLLDAASLYFRAFHGVPESVTSPDGSPVNAVRGLLDFITTLVSRLAPDRLVACMDADWRPAFRVAALPSYKAHRVGADGGEIVPPGLAAQVPVIELALDAIGIARVGVPGFEADDVIGAFAARAGCEGTGPVDIVTGDRDLFQLVRDDVPVRVVYTARGVGKADLVGEAWVRERYGVPARAYADFAVLRGDPSDGLPGVRGVGDKTAAALITRFGSLAGVLAALATGVDDVFPSGSRARLLAAADYLAVAPGVVRVRTDAPLPEADAALPATPRHPGALARLSARYGLDSPVRRLTLALDRVAGLDVGPGYGSRYLPPPGGSRSA